MMRTGDVVTDIKNLVNPCDYDLRRAEGCADFDDALRGELDKIDDPIVLQHASRMIRDWRKQVFNGESD